MEEMKGFFARAFADMKAGARAQREVDAAEFEAVRLENRLQREEARASRARDRRREELDARLSGANARAAEAREKLKRLEESRFGRDASGG